MGIVLNILNIIPIIISSSTPEKMEFEMILSLFVRNSTYLPNRVKHDRINLEKELS